MDSLIENCKGEKEQIRGRVRSISLPTRLHKDTAKENVKKLKSLNEDLLNYGSRDRSYTFAVSSKQYYNQEAYADNLPYYQDNVNIIKEYSPKVTKTVTSCNPLEQFQQQYHTETTTTCGQVKVMFQYLNQQNEFHCTLLRVSNVASGLPSPLGVYAKVCLSSRREYTKQSKHKYNSSDPVFNEKFIYKISLSNLIENNLNIAFYNKPKRLSFSKYLGSCVIDLTKYDITTATVMLGDIKKVVKLITDNEKASYIFIML